MIELRLARTAQAPRARVWEALVDPEQAAEHLAALDFGLDMASRLPDAARREGAAAMYGLSIGLQAPLAFRTVFTFDAGQWLVDLWRTDLERLFVARPDDEAVLALRRLDDVAEAYLGAAHA